jgi:hypothetical protein
MKVFALNYLADYLKGNLKNYEPDQLESKFYKKLKDMLAYANHVAYIINRELDLADLKGYSFV